MTPNEVPEFDTTLHPSLEPLAWLIGEWMSVEAYGKYPTIKNFHFCERLVFKSVGQPVINVSSVTWHKEDKFPMHLENGFLKLKPATKEVFYQAVHNFGLCTEEEGTLKEKELVLSSKDIVRQRGCAEVGIVRKFVRRFRLVGNVLEMKLDMETENQPMQEHIVAKYIRKS